MAKATKQPQKPWTRSRGPIKPDRFALSIAATINGLLVEPINVLPGTRDDTVKPFKIGISPELEARLKPDADPAELNRAIRRYTRCLSYLFAAAQPDAMRHDIGGVPVEPVSETDRRDSAGHFLAVKARRDRRRKERKAAETADASLPQAESPAAAE